ncbi:MAG: LON peptidase substrate-binding domain-containing protein [Pseudomonadota bacterium]
MSDAAPLKTGAAIPEIIPLFPLAGALLLPRGRLPLNIFEPRYLNMVDDALGAGRIIGMVQTRDDNEDDDGVPALYDVGCMGRITSFAETGDGRYLITLTGIVRFRIEREIDADTPYRQALARIGAYEADLAPDSNQLPARDALLSVLKEYLSAQDLKADWESIETADNETLVNSLAMICPFEPREKQALLEADGLGDRSQMLTALMEMALAESEEGPMSPLQ